MKKKIVIITGPTASGKTKLSIEVAKKLNGEIISADSMQIYKYMDIGTAKPSYEERSGIPHYMIDIINPDDTYSVALFRNNAGSLINDITNKNKIPIIVGGTGLYINSLIFNFDFFNSPEDKEYRDYLINIAKENGNEFLHSMLKNVDCESYNRLHINDVKRIIRALEIYKVTGNTISEFNRSNNKESEYDYIYIGLKMERELLYSRINIRVDEMFRKGLIDEVKKLKTMGYNRNLQSMQGIGYKEVLDYLNGLYTIDKTTEIIKQSTRRYAKRQLTWFNHQGTIKWFDADKYNTFEELLKNVVDTIEETIKLL